ncbi:hypothetical protein [Stratiformator vulcanicus]|uniref:Uncharacterized protein n=1 Tax=Stratiformator vulcanicus TaxID=2527980 RepID=A0A517QWY3_9PLAN|nr:hypothetical protein [Stratiformator vulcanicus]QDT36093.1 hypothetical protein Pan189_04480 [Stratiformator vulcanicus]
MTISDQNLLTAVTAVALSVTSAISACAHWEDLEQDAQIATPRKPVEAPQPSDNPMLDVYETSPVHVHVDASGRVWRTLLPQIEEQDNAAAKAEVEKQFSLGKPALRHFRPLLFEPSGRAWFAYRYGTRVFGYDGQNWVERELDWTESAIDVPNNTLSDSSTSRLTGNCPSRGQYYTATSNRSTPHAAWLIGGKGIHRFAAGKWSSLRIVPENKIVMGRTGAGAIKLSVSSEDDSAVAYQWGNPYVYWYRNGSWERHQIGPDPPLSENQRSGHTQYGKMICLGTDRLIYYTRYRRPSVNYVDQLGVFKPDGRVKRVVEAIAKIKLLEEGRDAEAESVLIDSGALYQPFILELLSSDNQSGETQKSVRKEAYERITAAWENQDRSRDQFGPYSTGKIGGICNNDAGDVLISGQFGETRDPDFCGLLFRQRNGSWHQTPFPQSARIFAFGAFSGRRRNTVWVQPYSTGFPLEQVDLIEGRVINRHPVPGVGLRGIDRHGALYGFYINNIGFGPWASLRPTMLALRYRPDGRDNRQPLYGTSKKTTRRQPAILADGTIVATDDGGGVIRHDGRRWQTVMPVNRGQPHALLPARKANLVIADGIGPENMPAPNALGGQIRAARGHKYLTAIRDGFELSSGQASEMLPFLQSLIAEEFGPKPGVNQFSHRRRADPSLCADRAGNIWRLDSKQQVSIVIKGKWQDLTPRLVTFGMKQKWAGGAAFLSPVGSGKKVLISNLMSPRPGGISLFAEVIDGDVSLSKAPQVVGRRDFSFGSPNLSVRDSQGAMWAPGYRLTGNGGAYDDPGRVEAQLAWRIGDQGIDQTIENGGWAIHYDGPESTPAGIGDPGKVWLTDIRNGERHVSREFRIWQHGKIVQRLYVPAVPHSPFVISDRRGSVFVQTFFGLRHVYQSIDGRYHLGKVYKFPDIHGPWDGIGYSSKGDLLIHEFRYDNDGRNTPALVSHLWRIPWTNPVPQCDYEAPVEATRFAAQ